MIQVWRINILVMPSRGRTEKSKNRQKHHRSKEPKDQNQGGQNPQKWENILRLQQSRCTIPWSHDTGVHNQHSRHDITWPNRKKQKWTKAPQVERGKGSESRRTKPPKMRKYFKTPTTRCTIRWSHDTGVDNQHSRHAITWPHREKQKRTKAPQVDTQRIRIKADKTPKNEKIF